MSLFGSNPRREKERRQAKEARTQSMRRSAKEWVGYDSMLRGGQAYLGHGDWSATIRLSDVSYQAADQEQQEHVIQSWAQLLNSFTAGQAAEITVATRRVDPRVIGRSVRLRHNDDADDTWRDEFNRLLDLKIGQASNGTVADKLLTVRVHDDDPHRAVISLNRLVVNVQAQLASMGCRSERLDRTARLRAVHESLLPDDVFLFTEERFARERSTDTRDYVTPYAFDLKSPDRVRILESERDLWHTTLWIRDFPPRLSDELIGQVSDLRACATVSIHLSPYDRAEGLKAIKGQKTAVDMQVDAVRRRNIRNQEPDDMLPPDLQEQSEQVDSLLDKMQGSNEKLIDALVVIGVSAPDQTTLEQRVQDIRQVLAGLSLTGERMRHMQLPGLVCELPLGARPVPLSRSLTTSAAAIMVPFTSQEHFDPTGVFYGTNTITGNLVAVDRTKLLNANGFILGMSGSGKSASSKWEIEHILLSRPRDRVIIIDPEGEYERIRQAFHGSRVDVSAGSEQRINPLDITLEGADSGENPVREQTSQVMAMLQSLIGGVSGLGPVAHGVLDSVVTRMYSSWRPGDPQPTLGDLQRLLDSDAAPEARGLSASLSPYVSGSRAGFNGQTNVDTNDRLTVYNTLDLDSSMMTFGMMVILNHVWNQIKENRSRGDGSRVWIYCDEFHVFFSDEYAASFFLSIYKRARKYGAGITGITQNIDELLASEQASLMFANSAFIELLRMNGTDAATVAGLLKLSQAQINQFAQAEPGTGLIVAGSDYVPFDGRIPTDSSVFELNSTNAATVQR